MKARFTDLYGIREERRRPLPQPGNLPCVTLDAATPQQWVFVMETEKEMARKAQIDTSTCECSPVKQHQANPFGNNWGWQGSACVRLSSHWPALALNRMCKTSKHPWIYRQKLAFRCKYRNGEHLRESNFQRGSCVCVHVWGENV